MSVVHICLYVNAHLIGGCLHVEGRHVCCAYIYACYSKYQRKCINSNVSSQMYQFKCISHRWVSTCSMHACHVYMYICTLHVTFTLASVAVCCSVLQCVAVCCSVLQCVAVFTLASLLSVVFGVYTCRKHACNVNMYVCMLFEMFTHIHIS